VLLESGLVWDACGILNLAATQHEADILASFNCPSYIVKEVHENEVIALRPLPEEDPSGGMIKIDLSPLFHSGLLQEVKLDLLERQQYALLAQQIDDGEARSAAFALGHHCRLVTDDKTAIKRLNANYGHLVIHRTPDWIRSWVSIRNVGDDEVKDVIRRINKCARYDAPADHPLKGWWKAYSETG
jgi:hypothetical protein